MMADAIDYNEWKNGKREEGVPENIRYLVAALYLVSAVLMFVDLKFVYNLDKKTLEQMNKELGR